MSGNGRRGRRGGRRQRRREEHARQEAAGSPAPTNGQSGPGHAVLPAAARAEEAVHPRPISARELVARLEAARAHEEAAASAAGADALLAGDAIEGPSSTPEADVAQPEAIEAAPRRFPARGTDWLAWVAGRGTGGTGRIAAARIGAIRFSRADEPDRITAEVIAPHARLDDLYDDELAELLERGLRWTNGNG